MISANRAYKSAKILSEYCKEQDCQNCIFRKFGADSWECHIEGIFTFDDVEVRANMEAKWKQKRRITDTYK